MRASTQTGKLEPASIQTGELLSKPRNQRQFGRATLRIRSTTSRGHGVACAESLRTGVSSIPSIGIMVCATVVLLSIVSTMLLAVIDTAYMVIESFI